MRHAKAVKSKDLADIERPLKKKGIKDVLSAAEYLKDNDQIPDYIVTSNAKRSVQTWDVMKKHLSPVGLHEKNHFLYLKGQEFYNDAIKNIPDFYDNALLIGHNPDIQGFLGDFLKSDEKDILEGKFSTSTIISLRLNIKSWGTLSKNSDLLVLGLFFT